MSPDAFLGAPDFPRNHWGQPLIVPATGGSPQAYKRASNYGSVLTNRSGIENWMKECVARGAALHPEFVELATATVDNAKEFRRTVEKLFIAGGGDSAAKLGTTIHDVLAQLDQVVIALADIAPEFQPHAQHWLDALEAHGFEVVPEYVECQLVCDEYQVAGSADNILRRKSDGALVIADKKTGKAISDRPIDYAVQLYLYANSELYDITTQERTHIDIDTNTAYLFHIPSSGSGCDVYEVDLQGTTKQAANLARSVHDIRRNFNKVQKLKATLLPVVPAGTASLDRSAWLKERIGTIIHHNDEAKLHLLRSWPADVPSFKDGYRHTDDQINAIIAILEPIEIFHDLPFGPCDPDSARIEERDIFTLKKAFPQATSIDDSGDVNENDITTLSQILDALPNKSKDFIAGIAKQASQSNRPLSLRQCPSPRRYEIAQALVSVSLFEDDDVVRSMVALIEPDALTNASLGHIFGGLRIDQAQHLQKIAHALDSEILKLAFTTSGTPEIHGDVQAIIAA